MYNTAAINMITLVGNEESVAEMIVPFSPTLLNNLK